MERRDCYPRPIFRDNQCRLDVSTASNKVFLNLNLTSAKQTFRFNKPIKDVLEVQVQSVEVPIAWNNTNNTNKHLLITDNVGASPKLITVEEGNWPATELAAYLTSQLTVANTPIYFTVDIIVSYSKITNKFTFENAAAGPQFILNADPSSQGGGQYPAGTSDTLYTQMGFPAAALPPAPIFKSNSTVNLTGSNSLYIKSRALTDGNFFGSSLENAVGSDLIEFKDTFIKIPVAVNPNFVVTERPMDAIIRYEKVSHKRLEMLDIELAFPSNNVPVDLNGQGWSISLMLTLDVQN